MSNGTKPAVLLVDLLSGDGPYLEVADDFLTRTCTGCGVTTEREAMHHPSGYFCPGCWAHLAAPKAV